MLHSSCQSTRAGTEPRADVSSDEAEALLRAFEAESSIASEPPNDQEEEPLGASGVGDFDPPLSPIEKEELQQHAREGPGDASAADPKVHTCPRLSAAELEAWRKHVQNGHVPYRRDCKQCVEGAGLGPFHRRVKYPRSFALSVDLFGPVPLKEAGRDESCVTGKNVLRYGLVGAFRVPQSFVHTPEGVDGVKDLCTRDGVVEPTLEDELAEYEPSEVGSDPNPNIPLPDSLGALFSPDHPEPPLAAGVAPEEAPESQSLLDGEDLPCSNEELQELVEELRQPVNQVVLRYFIPLRTKTGAEVSEALQRLILGINQRFPVRSIHHDPGTEFSSTSLSRWLAQHGVRVQHSLPTDKKGNGLSERTVGWVKSRIRTLLKGANLAVGWWPLAARWAVCKHNALILGESTLPAFGQTVLHRLKRPADGAKQLMERWVEARYGAPHRSIPEGHILITSAGTLVASKGFKSEVIDPTKVKELDLSVLQEQEHMLEEQDEVFDDQGRPLKRLKGKTSVRFVECIASPTSEELAHDFLVLQDYSLEAIRKVLAAIVQEEESTDDRRGIVEGKYILGAYCHGGLRGVTNLTKRKPWTSTFINRVLLTRLASRSGLTDSSWSAIMLMRAGDVGVHRDWRNERDTENYTMHVPGEVQLWVEPKDCVRKGGTDPPLPTWNQGETRALTDAPCAFDPRRHHAVRMQPSWLIIGYTPLGTNKLNPRDLMLLTSWDFPLGTAQLEPCTVKGIKVGQYPSLVGSESQEESWTQCADYSPALQRMPSSRPSTTTAVGCQVKALSPSSEDSSESSITSEELRVQIATAASLPEDPGMTGPSTQLNSLNPLAADEQTDSHTALIGWDFSTGDPGDHPHPGLVHVALADYLRVRGVSNAYPQLSALGIEEPNDLQFLYAEDLLEAGFARNVVDAIMLGIHPPGTRRPDNPQLSSLTSGEVRVLDRAQRPIPWIIQNRTLTQRCPGPPLAGLGCKQPDAKRSLLSPGAQEEELRAPDPLGFPGNPVDQEEVGADPTDFPAPQSDRDLPHASIEVPRRVHSAEQAVEDYQYMMYLQSMWGDEEWVPSTAAASSSCVPGTEQVALHTTDPTSVSAQELSNPVDREEVDADPTDFPAPQSSEDHRCMVVHMVPVREGQTVQSAQVCDHERGSSLTLDCEQPMSQGRQGASQVIGVPIESPLRGLSQRSHVQRSGPAVRRVDDTSFTPNVEELLADLKGPLDVVHNVSPAEVRRHLASWQPAAKAELDTFDQMGVVRKFFGQEARAILRDPSTEVIPGKAVCTVKPGDPFKRKFRVVSCGNFAKTTAESQLYAGGAGAECLRALLVHAGKCQRRAYGLDVKSAFLLADIPTNVTKRYAMRPPRLLIDLKLCTEDEVWMVDKALYGFRESPKWWADHRDRFLSTVRWETPGAKNSPETACSRRECLEYAQSRWHLCWTPASLCG